MIKRAVLIAYQKLKWAIPQLVRHELSSYAGYRRSPRARPVVAAPRPAAAYAYPYWERRETPNAQKALVRVGFIGAGHYAQHHLKALTQLEQVQVIALLSRTAEHANKTAKQYQIPRALTDMGAFLAEPVDCYVVVASAEQLKPLTDQCLSTGKPVLLEKPPAATAAETMELVQQAANHGTFGMVCMNRRFYSVLEHGLAALAGFGAVRGATLELPQMITVDRQSGRLSTWDYQNYMVRNSIHGIDLLRYVLGDPLQVYSLAQPNVETLGTGASFASILKYDRRVVATITDLWDTSQVWRLKVIAENGWVEFEPLETGFLYHQGRKIPIQSDPIDQEFRGGVYAQDLHYIEAVRAKRSPALPACLLPDAFKTMSLMEQIRAGNLENLPDQNLREEWFALQRSFHAAPALA